MTPDEIRLVQQSFQHVVPIREEAATLFYGRLFEIDPSTRSLFAHSEMSGQGRKLMAAIGMVVHALDAPETMLEKVKALARRHVGYGVEERHYSSVGAALLWTLDAAFGGAFTEELRSAWASAYSLLSETMIAAAREAAPVEMQAAA